MAYYICRRCNYKFKQKIDIRRHLERVNKCPRNSKLLFLTDEAIEELSLKKIISDEDLEDEKGTLSFDHQEIQGTQEDKALKKTKTEIICPTCNICFTRNSSLKRHLKNYCGKDEPKKEESAPKIFTANFTDTTNNSTTDNSKINVTNNILNINFNIDNKNIKIIPFDEDWDTSKFDLETKQVLLMSTIKFTKTMEKILENDANLNILIEEDRDSGIVYKNDVEKFKKMNINDIIDTSMHKLYKHLKQFYDEIREDNEFKLYDKYLDDEKNVIESKYDEYQTNQDTHKLVHNHLIDLYDKNKEKTISNYKKLIKKDKIDASHFIGF